MKFTGIFVSVLALLESILSSLPSKIITQTLKIKIEEGVITFGLLSEHLVSFKVILLIIALSFFTIMLLMGLDRNCRKESTFISILFSPILLSISLVTMILIVFSQRMIIEKLIINIVLGILVLYVSCSLSRWSLMALKRYLS